MTDLIEQKVIDFYGANLTTIKVDGTVYVVLKHMVEDMGLDSNGIGQLIRRDEVLSEGVCTLHAPSGGGLQPYRCLPIDLVPGLLFKIPTGYYDQWQLLRSGSQTRGPRHPSHLPRHDADRMLWRTPAWQGRALPLWYHRKSA